jgi:hypothetical protein
MFGNVQALKEITAFSCMHQKYNLKLIDIDKKISLENDAKIKYFKQKIKSKNCLAKIIII